MASPFISEASLQYRNHRRRLMRFPDRFVMTLTILYAITLRCSLTLAARFFLRLHRRVHYIVHKSAPSCESHLPIQPNVYTTRGCVQVVTTLRVRPDFV